MLTWITRAIQSLLQIFYDFPTKIFITTTVKKQEAARELPHIPICILSNILARVPSGSLQRLKSVSKQWLELISDPHFEDSHLAHHPGEFLLIHCVLSNSGGDDTYILEDSRSRHSRKKELPANILVHGSCKGLILFEKKRVFSVINPIKGDTLKLPLLNDECFVMNANIGFYSCSREYKVVVVAFDFEGRIRCCVLTLQSEGASAWREVDVPFPKGIEQFFRSPVYSRGALHWICSKVITSMNLDKELFFQQPELPLDPSSSLDKYNPIFLEWDGCLAVIPLYIQEPSYNVFILRESGWTAELKVDIAFFNHLCPSEIFSKDTAFFNHLCPLEIFDKTPPYPVASCRDGKVIIFKKLYEDSRFFAYHLGSGRMTSFTLEAPGGRSLFLVDGYFLMGTIVAHVNSMF